ncbi:MAG: hypothetical protein GKR87_11205 [Kiritimatiellae bacterium]|nr:hypothetical protein [Kiritimatiellia bacterium]
MNTPIEIEYNLALDVLTDLLAEVDRPGNFFVSSSMTTPLPQVEVDGLGMLAFPL